MARDLRHEARTQTNQSVDVQAGNRLHVKFVVAPLLPWGVCWLMPCRVIICLLPLLSTLRGFKASDLLRLLLFSPRARNGQAKPSEDRGHVKQGLGQSPAEASRCRTTNCNDSVHAHVAPNLFEKSR